MSKHDGKLHLITQHLANLIETPSIKGACRMTGISHVTHWNWLIRSRNGDPALQKCKFFDVIAPYHVHVENAAVLNASCIEAEARQRASEGVWVQVFKDGQPQYQMRDPKIIATMKELDSFSPGDEFERDEKGKRIPVLQLTLPPASLVEKMLSAHFPKKYGQRAELDVRLGGVLRLDPNAAPVTIEAAKGVFEDAEVIEQKGGYLAVAPPAQSSEEFDRRAQAGEFDAAPVTFTQNDGTVVTRMAEPDPLLDRAEQIRRLQPRPDDRPDVVAVKLAAIVRLEAAPQDARRPQEGAKGQRLPPAAPVKPVAPAQERWREQDYYGPGVVPSGGYRVR